MKGNICPSLHIKCFLKGVSLSFIGEMLTPKVQMLSSFSCLGRCTQKENKLLIIGTRLHPIKVTAHILPRRKFEILKQKISELCSVETYCFVRIGFVCSKRWGKSLSRL